MNVRVDVGKTAGGVFRLVLRHRILTVGTRRAEQRQSGTKNRAEAAFFEQFHFLKPFSIIV